MTTLTVSEEEFRTDPARFLREAREGDEVLVAQAVEAAIRLTREDPPPARRVPRQAGTLRGKIWIAGDFDETPQDVLDSIDKPL